MTDLITRCRIGAYANNEPYPQQPHFDLEKKVGSQIPQASWFVNWNSSWADSCAASAAALTATGKKYDILICWEASDVPFADIISGKYDAKIKEMVGGAAGYTNGNVVIRFFHEANGNWYSWAPSSGQGKVNGTAQFVQAWQHVVTVGRAVSTKVKYFWCMNAPLSQADCNALYPGDAYVDYIGADTYGGNGYSGSTSFDAGFSSTYSVLAAKNSSAPIWIGECGYSGADPQSAQYATSLYTTQNFPRLQSIAWFENNDFPWGTAVVAVHKAQLPRMAGAVTVPPGGGGTTPPPAVGVITNLKADASVKGQIKLTWTNPSPAPSSITVGRDGTEADGSSPNWSGPIAGNLTTVTFTGLKDSTPYNLTVQPAGGAVVKISAVTAGTVVTPPPVVTPALPANLIAGSSTAQLITALNATLDYLRSKGV